MAVQLATQTLLQLDIHDTLVLTLCKASCCSCWCSSPPLSWPPHHPPAASRLQLAAAPLALIVPPALLLEELQLPGSCPELSWSAAAASMPADIDAARSASIPRRSPGIFWNCRPNAAASTHRSGPCCSGAAAAAHMDAAASCRCCVTAASSAPSGRALMCGSSAGPAGREASSGKRRSVSALLPWVSC